jgi:hypothetical protein
MNCKRFETEIVEYVLDTADVPDSLCEEIESHIADCLDCRNVYLDTVSLIEAIHQDKTRIRTLLQVRTHPDAPIRRFARIVPLRRVAAMAACLLLAVALAFLTMKTSSPTRADLSRLENPRDASAPRITRLEGGHLIVANAGADFQVEPLRQGDRQGHRVSLRSGELYVEVAHNGNPFVVGTPNAEAVITGTRFEIRALPGLTDLILVEGQVQFSGGSRTVLVREGRVSSVIGNSAPSRPQPVDALSAVAWAREVLLRDRLARHGIPVERFMPLASLDALPVSVPPDPATLDYAAWRDAHRDWFEEQFPWIFKAQAALKSQHAIEADYLDLLMLSGDIWQFHYLRPCTQPVPVFDPASIERLAEHYGVPPAPLLSLTASGPWASSRDWPAIPVRTESRPLPDRYRASLQLWLSDLAAAEERPGDAAPSNLLLFSLQACRYLADTRTAAYLWIREHPIEADTLFSDPTRAPVIASALLPQKAPGADALTILGKQCICALEAENVAMERLFTRFSEPGNRRCGTADWGKQLSHVLSPLWDNDRHRY